MSKLNSTTLTIAAILLVVLALLVMATPLVRTTTGFTNRTGNRTFTQGGPSPLPRVVSLLVRDSPPARAVPVQPVPVQVVTRPSALPVQTAEPAHFSESAS